MALSIPNIVFRLALLWIVSLPALADTQFRVRRMTRDDVPLGKGQCEIRLRIDREVEVSIQGNVVRLRTISGRDGRDDGSECNEPLPARRVAGFNMEVRDSRGGGEILLLSEPLPRTRFWAVVRIRDSQGGEGRYHFRLTWRLDGGEYRPDRGGGYGRGDWPTGGDSTVARAIDACSDTVRDRIYKVYGYYNVDIDNARPDDRPGRIDYIIGDATGGRGFSTEAFRFSCGVDFRSGRVRSVVVTSRMALSNKPLPGDEVPSEEAAPEQAAPEQAAPEQASSEQAAPEQAAPEQASSEQAAPEQAAPEEASSEEAAPEQGSPEKDVK